MRVLHQHFSDLDFELKFSIIRTPDSGVKLLKFFKGLWIADISLWLFVEGFFAMEIHLNLDRPDLRFCRRLHEIKIFSDDRKIKYCSAPINLSVEQKLAWRWFTLVLNFTVSVLFYSFTSLTKKVNIQFSRISTRIRTIHSPWTIQTHFMHWTIEISDSKIAFT